MSTKISPGYSNGGAYTVFPLLGGRCVGRINQFVVMGTGTYTVRWCAIGDPTDWPTPATDDARAKQAGEQVMVPEYGWVTAIGSGDFYGYVFQERAITKMTYVGGDVVFSFDTFEEDRGCVRTGRMVQVDDAHYFQSDRGYHALANGQIADIGYAKVDDTY